MLRSINKRHRETVAAYIKRKLSGGRNMATLETLGWDNLEALCQDCHNKEHHRQRQQSRQIRR